jgi:hypothetical protein
VNSYASAASRYLLDLHLSSSCSQPYASSCLTLRLASPSTNWNAAAVPPSSDRWASPPGQSRVARARDQPLPQCAQFALAFHSLTRAIFSSPPPLSVLPSFSWKLIDDVSGTKIYLRAETFGSNSNSVFKGEGVVACPPHIAVELLMDSQKKPQYDSIFEGATVLEEITDHIKCQCTCVSAYLALLTRSADPAVMNQGSTRSQAAAAGADQRRQATDLELHGRARARDDGERKVVESI